jgi:hypothetical protein
MGNKQTVNKKIISQQQIKDIENIADKFDWLITKRRSFVHEPLGLPENYKNVNQHTRNKYIIDKCVPELREKLSEMSLTDNQKLRTIIIELEFELDKAEIVIKEKIKEVDDMTKEERARTIEEIGEIGVFDRPTQKLFVELFDKIEDVIKEAKKENRLLFGNISRTRRSRTRRSRTKSRTRRSKTRRSRSKSRSKSRTKSRTKSRSKSKQS